MMDRFSGDPKLYLTENGADLNYKGGQPVMDCGFENQANISLFTSKGWCGNTLFDEKIGSDFIKETKKPITLQMLNDVVDSAQKSLVYSAFGEIKTEILNPTGTGLNVVNTIKPVGQDSFTISLSRNGLNWICQNEQGALNGS